MFMVIMVIMFASFGLGVAGQNAADGKKVKKATVGLFKIIDRVPSIDVHEECGKKPESVDGVIELRHVEFAYPSRPDQTIYRDYSLKIDRGQTVALVGSSGGGKSTAISLIERFYDPKSGIISFDGHDLRELNLEWLRNHISLVSQEPSLFSGTVAENIAYGKPNATREEIIQAAKQANAHNFIMNFENGYDTDVGDRGAQVSGGQKQRIAIARAIVRDPEVLLLDEATSALDNESEKVVQESLDALMRAKKRTTIVIAHRLSTIRDADCIAVVDNGCIVEKGTHEELMSLPQGGIYRMLVELQDGNSKQ
jgi:ATP-binding cassette subfamily B (MDR/TAP) protein 1